jgi:O-antigen/teichoic acid export membrane protein
MSEIGKKSFQTFALRIVMQAFGVLGSIVIARTLGTGGKGIFTYAVTTLSLILAGNGQSAAIAWQYTKRDRSPARLMRVMMWVLTVFSVPIMLALMLIGWLVPGQRALLWVAIAAPLAMFMQSSTGFFLADSDVRTTNVQQLFPAVAAVVVYVPLLIFAHASVWILLGIWVASFAAGALYTAFHLRRYAVQDVGDDRGPLVWEQVKYSFQTGLSGLALLLNFRIDVFLIIFILGQSALGIYSVGLGIGELLWHLSRPIVTASFGRIARGTEAKGAEATATAMRHSFTLAVLAAILVFVVAPPVVPLVYGSAFAPAVIVTWLLLPGIVAYSMMGALATFFSQQLGEPRLPLLFRLLSIAICTIVTVLTLPRLGIAGGAIGTSISYLISFGCAATYFVRRTGIAPHRLFVFTKSDLVPYRSLLSSTLENLRRSPT